MATRSTIAIENADGTVDQIYSHWDGYLDCNGEILQDHYQDRDLVRQLIEQGDISSLDETVEATTFYARDRGETGCEASRYKDFEDYSANAQREEYNYIMRADGNWYVEFYSEFDGLLTEAFEYQKRRAELQEY